MVDGSATGSFGCRRKANTRTELRIRQDHQSIPFEASNSIAPAKVKLSKTKGRLRQMKIHWQALQRREDHT
jgi:hypothetical protein